jgi:hypothetical protein
VSCAWRASWIFASSVLFCFWSLQMLRIN